MPHHDDYQNLVSLGISPYIIKKADLNPNCYAPLYTLLKEFMLPEATIAGEALEIHAPWQLQLLCKKIDILPHLDVSHAIDNLGGTVAHYLALADSVAGLQWVQARHPSLLTTTNNFATSIAHSAAYAGSLNTLQWIEQNKPDLLIRTTILGDNIAHQAAKVGQVGVLQWLKSIKCYLFDLKNRSGLSITHCAMDFNQPQVLDWIKGNYPELLLVNGNDLPIAHYAVSCKHLPILEWIQNNQPELLTVLTKQGKNIAHCAAETGQLKVLQWINHYQSDLMDAKDYQSHTVIHAAVRAPNVDVLKWLGNSYFYLSEMDGNGFNIAHIASQQATVETLGWMQYRYGYDFLKITTANGKTIAHTAIKNPRALAILDYIEFNYPALIFSLDHNDFSIAHEAALHKRLDVLLWIKEFHNYARLFGKTKEGLSVKDYAAETGDIEFLNQVILLSPDPHVFHVGDCGNVTQTVVDSLLRVLEINVALTDVEVPINTANHIVAALMTKTERNKLIQKAAYKFWVFAGSYFANTDPSPPLDLLFVIFKQCFPENIADKVITRAFNKLMSSFSSENRFKTRKNAAIALIKKEISAVKVVDQQLSRVNHLLISCNLLDSSKPKVKVLQEIQIIVESQYYSFDQLKQAIIEFYQANKEMLNDALYKGPCFFRPTNEKSLGWIFNRLCEITDISREELANVALQDVEFVV